MIEIYADGACNPILNQGGWGAVVVEGGQKRVYSDAVARTTSNRMEITAVLEGILKTPDGSELVVYTDSQYVYGCVAKGWQRKANRDLWEKLDETVSRRKVHWEWIDQNGNNPFHKEAHNVATQLSSQHALPKAVEKPPETPVAAGLTHADEAGRPRMVDITDKPDTQREAVARGMVRMQPSTFQMIKEGKAAKGDVLTVAQLAGIMAAKHTADLIPLCHPILISSINIEFSLDEENSAVGITVTALSTGKTGVEMEALTAVAVAALTIYDMCKAVDRGMRIENIRLARKSGGKSGTITLE